MMGSSVAGGSELAGLLALLEDTTGYKKRLEDLEAAELKAIEAQSAANTATGELASVEAKVERLKREVNVGASTNLRDSEQLAERQKMLNDQYRAFEAERSDYHTSRREMDKNLSARDANLKTREAALSSGTADLEAKTRNLVADRAAFEARLAKLSAALEA